MILPGGQRWTDDGPLALRGNSHDGNDASSNQIEALERERLHRLDLKREARVVLSRSEKDVVVRHDGGDARQRVLKLTRHFCCCVLTIGAHGERGANSKRAPQ